MRNLLSSWFGPRARPARPSTAVPRRRPEVEILEDRAVPSISPMPTLASPGPVTITGTRGADQFVVRLQQSGTSPLNIQFSDNGGRTFQTAPLAAVTSVIVNGGGGKD